ncbi:mRNA cleavage and polyadenylation factor CLP1 p-loop domain-containing protein [Ditylenchus destructor]|nr:mRNA cleavage and polyadenylation factor CLP1 p-loop domain-containing protein [Ditylenchus destructor]
MVSSGQQTANPECVNAAAYLQYFACVDLDLSVLIVPEEGLRIMGAFAFQVLFGQVEANGYLCKGRKYNAKNFIHTSHPNTHVPLHFKLKTESPLGNVRDVVTSRLREIVSQPINIATAVEESQHCAIVLVKFQPDISSRFIRQHNEAIFRPATRHYDEKVMIGPTCYIIPRFTSLVSEPGFPLPSISLYNASEQSVIKEIIEKIRLDNGPILILGSKGVGKSTLMRYLVNEMLSRQNARKIFLLDTDVGQSEVGPPGCISLTHIEKPLLGASFASQQRSFKDSYFFGSNSPAVNFDLYLKQVSTLLSRYRARQNSENSLLFVNAIGWVEEPGGEILRNLLEMIAPKVLVNIECSGAVSFRVPEHYLSRTIKLQRKLFESQRSKTSAATLRAYLVAGYLAQCFDLYPAPSLADLRFSNILSFRVKFSTISVYFHSDLSHIADKHILCVLNCALVALCEVEEEFENHFETSPVGKSGQLPSRLVQKKSDNGDLCSVMLRCYGYGLIRAIDMEKQLFYMITPVESEILSKVKVFALGHELQTPAMVLDTQSYEPAPYLVELGENVDGNEKKFFSPLRRVGGVNRYLPSRNTGNIVRRVARYQGSFNMMTQGTAKKHLGMMTASKKIGK